MKQENETIRILIAGFGGQGLLFLGKLIALAASAGGKQVTWLPSYGPEMRGGTANCAVIISGSDIGSPIVSAPDVLIAMNLPSYQAFEPKVASGGVILLDSSLIPAAQARTDVTYYALPATRMATDASLDGLANMILLGKLVQEHLPFGTEQIEAALKSVLPEAKRHLLEANRKAIAMGGAYAADGEHTMHGNSGQARSSRRAG
jgi:2-oxoglutarate ferredoxin oxidoreductase subunit gamma